MNAAAAHRRLIGVALTAVCAFLLLLGGVLPGTPDPARAAPVDPQTGSAVTVNGRPGAYDDFSGLAVTVSQTRDLSAQGVTVTWTGGAPTGSGRFVGMNYLQFMQCWGPDPAAPDFRETCQYGRGLLPADPRSSIGLGNAVNTRSISRSSLYAPDPAEELQLPAADGARTVPFTAVDGTRTPNGSRTQPYPAGGGLGLTDYFDEFTTNEIPYARTAPDGTGRATFEVQTVAEAPGLGCGQPVKTGATVAGRPCWLVIVPRGEHDASGRKVTGNPNGTVVDGSPLSRGYFANRIAIKLDFLSIDAGCAQGRDERLTAGTELAAAAVQSWQPAVCASNGPVIGFIATGDAEANAFVREPASADGPGLGFVTEAREAVAGDPRVLHAPVALSAAVVAMQIETKIVPGAPEEVQKLRGTQVRDLRLTPRLVAKMLTQSYKADVPGGTTKGESVPLTNPSSVRNDPEFLALNPLFANFTPTSKPEGLMVTLGNSAVARQVWEWILADPDAVAWLAGGKDENGMVVNRYYKALFAGGGVPENFPKEDPSCFQPPEAETPPWCTFALRPYVNSLRDAALQTLRGDAKVRTTWDAGANPKAYKVAPPQPVGERFSLSVTDAASAARYGLAAASLRNRNGDFVAPTVDSLRIGVGAMTAGRVPGVVVGDPRRPVAGAYPLTMLTYAVVNAARPEAARLDYGRLLRHAAGAGQEPGTARGQLPAGYVPLPSPMRDQTRAVAAVLEKRTPASASPSARPPTATAPPRGPGPVAAAPGGRTTTPAAPSTTSTTGPAPTTPTGRNVVPDPGVGLPAVPNPVLRPSGAPAAVVPVAMLTERRPTGPRRNILLVILAVVAGSLLAGPTMLITGRRRTGSR